MFSKSKETKGEIGVSVIYSLAYTALYLGWIFGIVYPSEKPVANTGYNSLLRVFLSRKLLVIYYIRCTAKKCLRIFIIQL